jgi:hypothetical protein
MSASPTPAAAINHAEKSLPTTSPVTANDDGPLMIGPIKLTSIVSFVIVSACVGWVLWILQLEQIFSLATQTGGDAHTAAPAILRDQLLPQWRLTGYTSSWYAGMSMYQFYMVLPPLLIVILDVVMPYTVAFKIVTVLGIVTMPASAWAMGRLMRLPFPAPPLLAVATLPFLFDRGFAIYGGNIASTMAGEFNYSIAMSLALVTIGVVARSLQDQRRRVLAAVLIAVTVMCHLLVGFFLVTAVICLLAIERHRATGKQSITYFAPALVGSVLLTAWWLLPFWWHRELTFDMGWTKDEAYTKLLTRPHMLWAIILACFGAAASIRLKSRSAMALVAWTIIMGLLVRFIPEGRLWNVRLLPGYWLSTYLLAAVGVSRLGRGLVELSGDAWNDLRRSVWAGMAAVAGIIFVFLPMNALPFSHHNKSNDTVEWLGLSAQSSYLRGWTNGNYKGYENNPNWPEYRALMDTMETVGQVNGCGRAFWEYDGDQIGRYGTTMALMNLPYFTNWCIDSLEGVYFESSATTPFNFLLAAEGSVKPSNPVRDLGPTFRTLKAADQTGAPEGGLLIDQTVFNHAVNHMQLMGTRYYMAITPAIIEAGRAHPDLTELTASGPWVIFAVADSENVVGLDHLPYVEEGSDATSVRWRDTGVAVWDKIGDVQHYAAPRGPSEWPRIKQGDPLPLNPVENPTKVTNIQVGEHRSSISFDVDQIGKPVMIKWSYHPNFKVEGADGPYRVTPNFMVVIPRETSVSMRYGRGTDEIIGYVLTWIGVAGLIGIVVFDRRRRLKLRDFAALDDVAIAAPVQMKGTVTPTEASVANHNGATVDANASTPLEIDDWSRQELKPPATS